MSASLVDSFRQATAIAAEYRTTSRHRRRRRRRLWAELEAACARADVQRAELGARAGAPGMLDVLIDQGGIEAPR